MTESGLQECLLSFCQKKHNNQSSPYCLAHKCFWCDAQRNFKYDGQCCKKHKCTYPSCKNVAKTGEKRNSLCIYHSCSFCIKPSDYEEFQCCEEHYSDFQDELLKIFQTNFSSHHDDHNHNGHEEISTIFETVIDFFMETTD